MKQIAQSLAFASLFALAATSASAQAVRTEKNMSLDLANQIAAATVAACTANGYAVTATVVDRAGSVRAVQRADNAGPHTLAASEQSFSCGERQRRPEATRLARRRMKRPMSIVARLSGPCVARWTIRPSSARTSRLRCT